MDAILLVTPSVSRRSGKSNQKTPLGELLARLQEEFQADHTSFENVLRLLDVRPSRVKRAATWGSGLGRMKLNGRLIRYSPLSRFYELQALVVLVDLKRSMWETIKRTQGERLLTLDLDALIDRAERQLADLEPHVRRAAEIALNSD